MSDSENSVVPPVGYDTAVTAADASLPWAYGAPPLQALLRSTPDDFRVDEVLGYDADGQGEHALLLIEKRGANTDWVARELAKFAGVPPVASLRRHEGSPRRYAADILGASRRQA